MNMDKGSDTWEWTSVPVNEDDPRIRAALEELRDLIVQRYPDATFITYRGDDPDGIRLAATVDVEELDGVSDIFMSRLVDMQVEDGLPVYVVLGQPLTRVTAALRQQARTPIEARLPAFPP